MTLITKERDEINGLLRIDNLYTIIGKNLEEYKQVDPKDENYESVQLLIENMRTSTSGDPSARKVVKAEIKNILQRGFSLYKVDDITKDILDIASHQVAITSKNNYIDEIIPFENTEDLSIRDKFEIIMYLMSTIENNGRDGAFRNMKKTYPFFKKEDSSLQYTEEDINNIFNQEYKSLSFNEKLDIVAHRIYSNLYGLRDIDILAYSDINEIGVSRDGDYVFCQLDQKIRLTFMKFTLEETKSIQNNALSFEGKSSLSEMNPESLSFRKDGSRITAIMPPYSSSRSLRIRIFNQSNTSFNDLVENPILRSTVNALIKCCENSVVQGGLGVGKTTTLSAFYELLSDDLHIGTVEDTRELNLKEKYPNKLIEELQSLKNKNLLDCVKTILRLTLDIATLGEVRSGEALQAFVQLALSVSISSSFTLHAQSPYNTIPRLLGLAMESDRYLNEVSAMQDILKTINCIFQMENIEGNRYITRIVEIVPAVDTLSTTNIDSLDNLDDIQKIYAKQQILSMPKNMYTLNELVDARDPKNVKFVNYPSEKMINRCLQTKGWPVMKDLIIEMEKHMNKPLPSYLKDKV